MGATEQNRAAAAMATMVAALMIAQQVAGKAIRDAFFLSNWAAENLPLVMATSSLLSVLLVLGFTRLVIRHSPARVVPVLFAVHGLLYAAEWALAGVSPGIAAVSVYIHSTTVGATVVSGFWSVINERFDPHTAKRFIARIAGGATFGGVIGGVVAWQAGQWLELSTMLIVLTAANLGCAFGIVRMSLASRSQGRKVLSVETVSGLKVMKEVPYLRHVALLVITATMVEACIDYVFKAEAKASFDAAALITFFAIFHAVVALMTFLMQTGLARYSLQRLGLTGTVASLPSTTVLGSVVALIVPGAWPLVGLRGAGMSVENSLYRSGYELLYTPLTASRKRPTKTIIDVGADRLGTLIGSGIAFAAIWFAPEYVRTSLLVVAFIGGILALVVTGVLHRGYVSALADSLRQGAVTLEPDAAEDATTRRTLADTAMALDREKLLEQIAVLRTSSTVSAAETGTEAGEASSSSEGMQAVLPLVTDDEIANAVADLRTGDVRRVRKVFSTYRAELPSELIAPTIELLARDDLHHQAIEVLRRSADQHSGQLTDALLDPSVDFAIRRRIPRVLVKCPLQRSADGLLDGLGDERFEVRYRAGLALYQITQRASDLRIDKARIFDAALREAQRGEHVWRSQTVLDRSFDEEETPFVEGADRVGRSLEHVFTILSVVLEREPLQLAYRALASEDEALRGTGLEYLENVLPSNIRDALWPYLGDQRVTRRTPRDQQIVVKDLLNSMSSMAIDLKEVRDQAARLKKDE